MEEEIPFEKLMKRSTESSETPPPKPDPYEEKKGKIREACKWRDVQLLRELATSEGGLVTDNLRCIACTYPTTPQVAKANIQLQRANTIGL